MTGLNNVSHSVSELGLRRLLLIDSYNFAMGHGCGGAGEETVVDEADCYRINEKGCEARRGGSVYRCRQRERG